MSWYHLNVSIHVLAALVWLGGMFFLALVGAPALRTIQSAELRAQLFRVLGERFRTVGWICIAILLVTGVLNLHFRGLLSVQLLRANFWATPYGGILALKLLAVLGMLLIQAIHDFSHGPKASRATPGTAEAMRMRRRAALLARVSAVFGIVVLLAAVRLTRP